MVMEEQARADGELEYLSLFCSSGSDGWRVHTIARWLPRYVRQFFHRGQAYPVPLDFAGLEEQMKSASLAYKKRFSTLGGVEITARGPAAVLLCDWIASMFATGVRPQLGATSGEAR